jgi:hypothetical protein
VGAPPPELGTIAAVVIEKSERAYWTMAQLGGRHDKLKIPTRASAAAQWRADMAERLPD